MAATTASLRAVLGRNRARLEAMALDEAKRAVEARNLGDAVAGFKLATARLPAGHPVRDRMHKVMRSKQAEHAALEQELSQLRGHIQRLGAELRGFEEAIKVLEAAEPALRAS